MTFFLSFLFYLGEDIGEGDTEIAADIHRHIRISCVQKMIEERCSRRFPVRAGDSMDLESFRYVSREEIELREDFYGLVDTMGGREAWGRDDGRVRIECLRCVGFIAQGICLPYRITETGQGLAYFSFAVEEDRGCHV